MTSQFELNPGADNGYNRGLKDRDLSRDYFCGVGSSDWRLFVAMEEIKKFWSELMEIPEARWIVAITGLVMGLAIGYYFVKQFRDMALGRVEDPASYITDFQKLRNEGKLDEEEYSRLAKAIPKQTLSETDSQSKPTDSAGHAEDR